MGLLPPVPPAHIPQGSTGESSPRNPPGLWLHQRLDVSVGEAVESQIETGLDLLPTGAQEVPQFCWGAQEGVPRKLGAVGWWPWAEPLDSLGIQDSHRHVSSVGWD